MQQLFQEHASKIELLVQKSSLNPLLARELRNLEKEIYVRAKQGDTQAIQKLKEASELEKALDTFQPNAIYVLERFLPRVFRAFEQEQEGLDYFDPNKKSYLEKLVLQEGLISPTLKSTINDLFVQF